MTENDDEDLESALLQGDRAASGVYAQGLEARGDHLRAAALRSYRRAPRFRPVTLFAKPGPTVMNPPTGEPLVMRVLLLGDFRGEADPRPIPDRRIIELKAAGVNASLALEYVRRGVGVRASSLTELRAAPDHVHALWHGADWLARSACPIAVEVVHATADDLSSEMQDASSFDHSWVRALFNDRNHAAIEPRHLLILGFELDPIADRALVEHVGRLGERHAVPVLVPTSRPLEAPEVPEISAMRRCSWARWLTFCAHASTLLVARQAALMWGAAGSGTGLWGNLREPKAECVAPSTGVIAWERGFLAPVRAAAGAKLVDDATFSSEEGTRRSLSWLLLAQRITHEAKLIHYQHCGSRVPGGTGAEPVAAFLQRHLLERFPSTPGFTFAIERPSWETLPEDPEVLYTQGSLELDLRLVATTPSGEPVTHVEPLTWRFSF